MSSIGFLCLLFLIPNFAYSAYMTKSSFPKFGSSRSISTQNMGKKLAPKREIKPTKNFWMKTDEKAVEQPPIILESKKEIVEKPHIDRDKIPLIIIGVPGMGYNNYEGMLYCFKYILRLFSSDNDKIQTLPTSKGATILISSSPQRNKVNITIDNYKQSKDFEYFLSNNEINEKKTISTYINAYNNAIFPNSLRPDLGGKNCQTCFEKTVVKRITDLEADTYRAIFYANSQGTATVLNYIANLVKNNNYNEIDNTFNIGGKNIIIEAITLESVFATRRSAILHTVKNMPMEYPPIKEIHRYLRYFPPIFTFSKGISSLLNKAPEIANFLGNLDCQPNDQEPIESIQAIPCTVPIFITHTQYDPQTPFSDAKALYYARKNEAKCNNTFFIPVYNKSRHSELFDLSIKNIDQRTIPYPGNQNRPFISTLRFAPFITEALYDQTVDKSDERSFTEKFQTTHDKDGGYKKEYDNAMRTVWNSK